MNDQEREMDFLLAECEQENRLLRARNERLNAEVQILTESLRVIGVREWVGLDEEDEIDWEEGGSLRDLVEAVEAKLKEKNG